jgi:hypothetical protein
VIERSPEFEARRRAAKLLERQGCVCGCGCGRREVKPMDTFSPGWQEAARVSKAPTLTGTLWEIYDAPRAASGKAIRCLVCGQLSYHPNDVTEKFCARCGRFQEDWSGFTAIVLGSDDNWWIVGSPVGAQGFDPPPLPDFIDPDTWGMSWPFVGGGAPLVELRSMLHARGYQLVRGDVEQRSKAELWRWFPPATPTPEAEWRP